MTDKQQLQNFRRRAYVEPWNGNYSDLVEP